MESANVGEMGKVEHAAPIKMLDLQSKNDKPCVVKFHGDFGAGTGRNPQFCLSSELVWLRSNASSNQTGPKRLSIERVESYKMICNMIDLF